MLDLTSTATSIAVQDTFLHNCIPGYSYNPMLTCSTMRGENYILANPITIVEDKEVEDIAKEIIRNTTSSKRTPGYAGIGPSWV